MTRFVCRSCGATWLSEPAALLIQRHDGRCLRCDRQVERESENERVLRQHFDALNYRDEHALVATLHADVSVRAALVVMCGGPPAMHGVPSVIDGFRMLKQCFTEWWCALRVVDEHPEGRMICEGSVSATRVDGGSEARDVFWAVRMRDGRVVEVRSFERPEDARQSLELTEP